MYGRSNSINKNRRTTQPQDIPGFKFKNGLGESKEILYTWSNGHLYLRVRDIWSALTLRTGIFGASSISSHIDMGKVRFEMAPTACAVYALTIEQALQVCDTFSTKDGVKVIHPVERWIRETVIPASTAKKETLTSPPIWTPDDIPEASSVTPIPLRIIPREVPQPEIQEPEIEAPSPGNGEAGHGAYSLCLRYPDGTDAFFSTEETPSSTNSEPEPPAISKNIPNTMLDEPSNKFDFFFNGRRKCHIYAERDESGCVWVGTRGLESVFGPLLVWPQSVKNSKRRVIHCGDGAYSAIHEAAIAELRQALTPSEQSSGTFFVQWLEDEVKPAIEMADDVPLESKLADFFFKGVNFEVHVSADDTGELWASVKEIEDMFNLRLRYWPEEARASRKKTMSYNGGTFRAVSEEYLDDIADAAPSSRKGRTNAFSAWWVDFVWSMFNKTEKENTEAPIPTPPSVSLAEQARVAAQVLLSLAEENESLRSKADKARAIISKQSEQLQLMFRELERP
jgi:hypothetical protein